MFTSKTTRGFYDPQINGDNMPPDAVEITDSLYSQLMNGQSNGQLISWADDGIPYLADPPAPTKEQLAQEATAARDQLLRAAATRIAPLQDAVDLDDATAAEVAELKAWKQYRVALNRIDQQPGYPTTIEWPISPAKESA